MRMDSFLIPLFGYLFCSILWADVLSKVFYLPNPSITGSNNVGATNMARINGLKYGIITGILDCFKGFVCVHCSMNYSVNLVAITLFCSVLGHIFPIFYQFKGGKGVSAFLGALTALDINFSLLFISSWIIGFFLTRTSGIASLFGVTFSFIFMLSKIDYQVMIAILFCIILIYVKHAKNIKDFYSINV